MTKTVSASMMDESNLLATCDRIEAALARIDRAAARVEDERTAMPDAAAYEDLHRRHAALREATAHSLRMIDALIAGSEAVPDKDGAPA